MATLPEKIEIFTFKHFVFAISFMNGLLLSASKDKTIKVWAMNTYDCINTLEGHNSSVTSLIPFNDLMFASGSTNKSVKIWDMSFKNIETRDQSQGSITTLVSLNNTYLASASSDTLIRVYKTSQIAYYYSKNGNYIRYMHWNNFCHRINVEYK